MNAPDFLGWDYLSQGVIFYTNLDWIPFIIYHMFFNKNFYKKITKRSKS